MVEAEEACTIFIKICLLVLLVSSLTYAIESDINCLRTLKSQLKDPNGHLSNWVFVNKTDGFICKFNGVSCWNDEENRILSIDLSGFDLQGKFPNGVKECSSLSNLNLSRNNLTGTIQSDVFSDTLSLLTTLDLSYNSFSGEIPPSLSNIVYLNNLLLDHNYLTGHIPTGLALIQRLKQFSVAYNHLKGPIPEFNNGNILLASFEGNPDLCGLPLDPCSDPFFNMFIIPAVITAANYFPVGAAIGWFCFSRWERTKTKKMLKSYNLS